MCVIQISRRHRKSKKIEEDRKEKSEGRKRYLREAERERREEKKGKRA